jgi:hypothetical protein
MNFLWIAAVALWVVWGNHELAYAENLIYTETLDASARLQAVGDTIIASLPGDPTTFGVTVFGDADGSGIGTLDIQYQHQFSPIPKASSILSASLIVNATDVDAVTQSPIGSFFEIDLVIADGVFLGVLAANSTSPADAQFPPTGINRGPFVTNSGLTRFDGINVSVLADGSLNVGIDVGGFRDGTQEDRAFGVTLNRSVLRVVYEPSVLSGSISIHPETLKLSSNGNYVTTYIELPEGFEEENIDVGSVAITAINGVAVTPLSATLSDCQDTSGDGVCDTLMVKFDRASLAALLTPGLIAEIEVSGSLLTNEVFRGTDSIRTL